MLRVDRRAGGIGGGSGCNTMPPKPLKGDFLFPPSLFLGLLSLRGDALFGGPFSLCWQVVLLSTSPTSDADAAAPDVDVPSPFALSGASPSLHARHEEQRFCSYSSHSNSCIGGMATTRRGGYRIAGSAFY